MARYFSLLVVVISAASFVRAEERQAVVTPFIVIPFKTVQVSSPVLQEVIDSVLVEEGAEVNEGQPVVQLRAEREALEVERTQKLIELATFKAQGAEALFKEKMGSKEKWLEEQAQLELAKILHRVAEVALKEKTVLAPLSGVIVKKYKEAGESVDRAEKLLEIVNIDQVYVQFYLEPGLLGSIKEGQQVQVTFPANNNAKVTGTVAFIDPRLDAATGNLRIKVLIDNKDRSIKAGMRATAEFSKHK
jgi:membrane fusion protein (multidrug efflux system)